MILGIELGSTRIKSVLIDRAAQVICQGEYAWENTLTDDGLWTYAIDEAIAGLQESYRALNAAYRAKTGADIEALDAIGISAMMHGYLVFDKDGCQLAPFRTWRNTNAAAAAEILSERFRFHVPMRWSVSQYYQSVLNGLEHVPRIAFMTTLAGYIHYRLTGRKVIGANDASGIFPTLGGQYHEGYLASFGELLRAAGITADFRAILPQPLLAGEPAGVLTVEGAALLDPSGHLSPGCPFCPPEGDMGTGMIATGCVSPGQANLSCGTSGNLTVVMERPLAGYYPEIDVVDSPNGHPAALIHANNCTSEINAWVGLFDEVLRLFGTEVQKGELFRRLFLASNDGSADVGTIASYNFTAGEPVVDVRDRCLMTVREDSDLSLGDFMLSQIYAAVAPLAKSKQLLDREQVAIRFVTAHGGYFKTADIGQRAVAALLDAPITVTENAGEGGAWGVALLALYLFHRDRPLEAFLKDVIGTARQTTVTATETDKKRFAAFMARYNACLPAVRLAIEATESFANDSSPA